MVTQYMLLPLVTKQEAVALRQKGYSLGEIVEKLSISQSTASVEYHSEKDIKQFWSNLSGIPLVQFNKFYKKEHTGINTKIDYKGCFRIRYYDAKIAKYLTLLYKTFATHYLGL